MIQPAPIDPPEIHDKQWEGFTGRVGWDVGSNVGQSIPEMLRRFEFVHAFEPGIEALEYLLRWGLPEDLLRLNVWPLALSSKTGMIDLGVLEDKIDSGQLVTTSNPGGLQDDWSRMTMYRTVPAMAVDDMALLVGPPDFLKIDVEGHEFEILRGASYILANERPDFLIEIHSVELGRDCSLLLRDHGYDCEEIRHPYYKVGSDHWQMHYWVRARPRR